MIRVLITDDQSLMRMGFGMVIGAEEDMEVVGEASNGLVALQQVKALKPDVVLMDVRMPEMDGIAATKAIAEEYPETKILILTTFDLDEYAFAALQAGASGFLLKDAEPASVVDAIRAIAGGDAVVSPRITRRMIELFADRMPRESDSTGSRPIEALQVIENSKLTSREVEVWKLLARGLSNHEIAEKLFLSTTTIKTHVGNILAKLGVRDRVQAVVVAYEHNLLGDQDQVSVLDAPER
ncbi:response regulator [Boudabousia marimammalium]|uniref:DNA-binding response regulator n=1 Tax=Boudabousia marimammalium TaxID=156892 RepID=A0A1Q5PRS1_9ACTO|nr:response regulator transcription factor [Boudabousia marimammalium]OKL50271.1 DNA-binding response regulator [Boudabousia marimammalium]